MGWKEGKTGCTGSNKREKITVKETYGRKYESRAVDGRFEKRMQV